MSRASLRALAANVARAGKEAGIPGLSFAVSVGGKRFSAAAGVLNIETGIEATPNSLFQIGSITKSLTSTLIMQAADARLIDIDAPVKKYIPQTIGRGKNADTFTARHLMAHLSGLDGDLFLDSGRDDDALAKYMVLCEQLEFLSAPGRYYNYCNAGYTVLGRMLEVVRGATYDEILRKHLFDPLKAPRSTTMPEEAAFRRTATGHFVDPTGKATLAPLIHLPRALGPAGLSLYSTTEELIAYAEEHMAGGKILSRKSAQAMRTPHAALAEGASWGLGWKLIKRGKVDFVGHDGGTIGQVASLWTAPKSRLAIAMCANGGASRIAWEKIAYPIFREVCGEVPEILAPEPLAEPGDLSIYEGAYDNLGLTTHITVEDGRLKVVAKHKTFAQPDTIFYMRAVGDHRFRATIGDDDKVITAFYEFGPDNRPTLFYAGRLHRRIEG